MKISLEARKNRFRRRMIGGVGESLSAAILLIGASVLSLLIIYVYCSLLSASYFRVRDISVRGVKELTEKDILALASVGRQVNILAVNTEEIRRRIGANPWVKAVSVGRELPDRLVLHVRERKPVALVKQSGSLYLMDAGGVVFKKFSRGDDVDLAILTGVDVEHKADSGLLPEALKLLDALDANSPASLGTVSEVQVNDTVGLSLLTDKGLHLKLGRDNFGEKLKHLDIVLADLEKRGMKNGRLFVDLTDVSKVTVQRREALGKTTEVKAGPQYRL